MGKDKLADQPHHLLNVERAPPSTNLQHFSSLLLAALSALRGSPQVFDQLLGGSW